jgi:hypothetical protein
VLLGASLLLTQASAAQPTDAVSRIEALGGTVRLLTSASNTFEVDFQFSGAALKDEHLPGLLSIEHIAVLRLKNSGITDACLSHVAKLTKLKRLDLSGTAITDTGLKHLTTLKELETLNLFGTAVTDTGLDAVKDCPSLKQLFVWKTKVSADGIARLQKARPTLRVIPDPAADREHARIIAETAAAALVHAQEALPLVKKESEEMTSKAGRLKKEFEELKQRSDQNTTDIPLRKEVEAKQKILEEASKKADKARDAIKSAELAITSARQQSEDAQRDLAKSLAGASNGQPVKP